MSAPVLDSVRAMEARNQQTLKDLKAPRSSSKDDNAAKENASDSEPVDRFDTQK